MGLQGILHLGLHALVADGRVSLGEAQVGLTQVGRTEVRGHDQDGVAEVHGATLGIGQATLLQDLEQRVEDVRVSLLDLVKQHHGERSTADGLGELAPLLVSDITGG